MGQVNKLQKLCPIAASFQQTASDAVCEQGRHPLLDDAVFGQDREGFCFDLPVQFMLAAGNGKDHLSVPLYGIVEGKIRGRITGMQCDDHINDAVVAKTIDITHLESQMFIAVFLRHLIAVLDHISLQVQTDHFHRSMAKLHEIIVQNESQVGFPAAEVHNGQLLISIQRGNSIVYNFDKPVDLAIFVIHGLDHSSVRGENT